MNRILLALSGGVDSSAAAVLLRNRGYEVVGCTMQLWDATRNPPGSAPAVGRCCSLDDAYDARRVADTLGFPFYMVNMEKDFEQRVIAPFIGEYLAGRTPIPCTLCNTFLKFDRLLDTAREIGIDRVATGHYARTRSLPDGTIALERGRDRRKDQTYFLFELSQDQLSRIEFPVGDFEKAEIRTLARQAGLPTARKAESQEICFVPDGDYAGFIRRHAGEVDDEFLPVLHEMGRPGPILFRDGTELGRHSGLYHYTVGQRRGLGIAHSEPLYVMEIDVERNALKVGYQSDVYSSQFRVERVNWIMAEKPDQKVRAEVRVRSNHEPAAATVSLLPGRRAEVSFDHPQLAVTPGQAAVFYSGARVLGGGWITGSIDSES